MEERSEGGGVVLVRRRRAVEWRRLVRAWKESGELAAKFAAARGLCANTLRWWSSELNRRDRSGARETPLRFVELMPRPASEIASVPLQLAHCPQGSGVEVVLSSRRVVRVALGFDAVTLQRVVVSLEARPC